MTDEERKEAARQFGLLSALFGGAALALGDLEQVRSMTKEEYQRVIIEPAKKLVD